MITDAKFERGITLLQQHFNRKLSEDAIAIWREHFDDNLNDEEFTQAIKEAILGCEFFPTAKKLVEFINGGKEAQALQQWQDVLRAAAGTEEAIAYLSTRGRVALQAVGGLRTIGCAEERSREKLERNFVAVYCQCSDKDSRSLPQGSSSAPQAKREPCKGDTHVWQDSQEFSSVPDHIKAQMEDLAQKMGVSRAAR